MCAGVISKMESQCGRKIAEIGLGYVGLPVAVAFAPTGIPVIGFDIGPERVGETA